MTTYKYKDMGKIINRKLRNLADDIAETYAVGALTTAVDVSPFPALSKWSTGRSRESSSISDGSGKAFDPGVKANYGKPNSRDATRGLRGWSLGKPVVFRMGTPYRSFVYNKYRVLVAAHRGGNTALSSGKSSIIRKANEL